MAPQQAGGGRRIASLLGHRQVDMAVLCLGSLLRRSAEPLALRLHDDGTLTEADRERLAGELDGPEVVSRAEADERVADALAPYPILRAYRRESPLALKLVDAALLAGEELAYCDADVLFLCPFAGLFRLEDGAGALFMSDRQNAYSVRSWHLLRHRRLRLPRRVNTGIVVFRTAAWDPDLLSWYLARPEFAFAPVWREQTAWALLGGKGGCRLLDPAQVAIPELEAAPRLGPVALHFVGPVRSRLSAWAPLTGDGGAPEAVRSRPARPCRAVDLASDEARRVLRRLVGRQAHEPPR
ncbi:MAG TPA: hypothetical protein VF756_11570 [Thermoanaerobaculia bacterium]